MNLEDLKTQWRTEMQVSSGGDLRLDRIKGDVAEWNRETLFGNSVAIIASVCGCVLAVIFGWLTQEVVRPEQKLAIIAYVIFTMWLTYSLLKSRRVSRSDAWTLRARLEIEIERLGRQRNLSGEITSDAHFSHPQLSPMALYSNLWVPLKRVEPKSVMPAERL